jgi:hypothetical protein
VEFGGDPRWQEDNQRRTDPKKASCGTWDKAHTYMYSCKVQEYQITTASSAREANPIGSWVVEN